MKSSKSGSPRWLSAAVMAIAMLLAGLSITAYSVRLSAHNIREQARLEFNQYIDLLETAIQTRFNQPLYGLRGAIGAQASVGMTHALKRANFKAYVAARDLATEFPGIQGIGYIEPVQRANIAQFEAAQRADDAPEFRVKTQGDDPTLYVIKYIEPLAGNLAALGLDLGSEPVRRKVVEQAINTGLPSLSGTITLVQDRGRGPGYLYAVPVYPDGTTPDTLTQRRAQVMGLFYAPLSVAQLLDGTVKVAHGDVDFDLYDGVTLSPATLVFSSQAGQQVALPAAGPSQAASHTATRLFEAQRTLLIGGRALTLRAVSSQVFEAEQNQSSPLWVGVLGAALSSLLATITWLLLRGRARAMALARDMNKDLQAQRESLNNIIEGTHAGTWEWNIKTSDVIVNARFAEIVGSTLADLTPLHATTWATRAHPDDLARITPLYVNHIKGAVGYVDFDMRVRHQDGHWVWVNIRGKISARTATGKPLRMAGTQVDISAQKQSEADIARTSNLLKSVLEAASEVAIVATGLDRKITLFNTGAERMLGYTAAEVTGIHTTALFFDAEELTARAATLSQELGQPVQGYEVVAHASMLGKKTEWQQLRKDGSRFLVTLVLTPLLDVNGVQAGYLGISQDISVEKAYEGWLRGALDKAEAATLSKSQFLANMSHELRTPMNAILGMLKLLQNTDLTARQLDYAVKTEGAAKSLLGLLNDILDFSKMDAGKMTLDVQPFRIDRLLGDLSVILSATVGTKPLEVRFDVDSATPKGLLGDAMRLQQVLINLGSNAIKFTPQGEVAVQIKAVAVNAHEATLHFAVRDSGIGIAPENLQRIFDGFSQAEASTTRRFGGTGLGLTISRRLVALMGGDLQVESVLGTGSTFHFMLTLPLAQSLPEDLQTPADVQRARKSLRRLAGLRLLVVEDNMVNQQVALELLRFEGAQVELADNGLQALAAIANAEPPFSAVLMDIQMPVMDGYTATRAIRNELGLTDLPVIAMTANAMTSDREACLDAGMNEHVGKPFDLPHLIDVLLRLTRSIHPSLEPTMQRTLPTPAQANPAVAPPVDSLSTALPPTDQLERDAAIERLGGDVDLYNDIMQAYLEEIAAAPDQLANHVKAGDADAALRLMHTIKGLSATVGACHLEAVSRQAEAHFKAEMTAGVAAGLPPDAIQTLFADAVISTQRLLSA